MGRREGREKGRKKTVKKVRDGIENERWDWM